MLLLLLMCSVWLVMKFVLLDSRNVIVVLILCGCLSCFIGIEVR